MDYSQRLLQWYGSHFRPLPWRLTPTPYTVWISEIMLQQTRIEAVLGYYQRFVAELPDVAALAAVPEDRLLKLWEGLGYYSRARNLQKCAKVLMERYGGELPRDPGVLETLPGIGAYTAGAIASLAYDVPVPAVDGNVMRVLSRLYGDATDVLSSGAKKHFAELVSGLMPAAQAGRFNQALMELGETVCLPAGTCRCEECPWHGGCVAERENRIASLPVRSPKKPRRVEHHGVAVIVTDEAIPRVLIRKRPPKGLLAGLWELPHGEGEDGVPDFCRDACRNPEEAPCGKHIFTHVEWRMTGKVYRVSPFSLPAEYRFATWEECAGVYALPSAFRLYADLLSRLLVPESSEIGRKTI